MTTGYFTQTQLVSMQILTDSLRIKSDQLKDLIEGDVASDEKSDMLAGENYYAAEHDILDVVPKYFIRGAWVVDSLKEKTHLNVPHPFHKMLVNQKTAYAVGKPLVVSVSERETDPENEEAKKAAHEEAKKMRGVFLNRLSSRFDDIVNDWVKGASNKGQEWLHFYINPAGELRYIIINAIQVIPVYDTQYQEVLVGVIRYYTIEYIDPEEETKELYRVEWWTKSSVEYFVQRADDGVFIPDPDRDGPQPHFYAEYKSPDVKMRTGANWGRVPFVPLFNNSEKHSDLKPIKILIDAYDTVKSGWVNDLIDFQELIYVLKGFEGMSGEAKSGLKELALFIENLKNDKVIAVEAAGDVDTVKAEIPVEAKEKFLTLTWKEIYYFGEGVDVANEDFQAPSGIALQHLYSGLDLKANRLLLKLKEALSGLAWFVCKYIEINDHQMIDPANVTFAANKSMIFNEKEKIEECVSSKDVISNKTIMEHHPWVEDPDEEQKRLDAEEEARAAKGMVDLGEIDPNAPEIDPATGKPIQAAA